ncbi:MAG: lasso peptide biosynthesis B2 protein [Acidobacteria bacterium]|nr:lasso peptide biosynthesis B2 protein [Acidobacteriota bacterium]MCB9396453.1 lasso peptide biosynthesis B2 protein [Acidobacteriota bacterium]
MAYWFRRLKKGARPLKWSRLEWKWFLHFFFKAWLLFFSSKLSYRHLKVRLISAMSAPVEPVPDRVQPVLLAYQRVFRWMWVPRNCLRDALLLHEGLLQHQVSTRLIIGVTTQNQFKAHAWLVGQDGPLLQNAEHIAEYVEFNGDFSQWMA